MQSGSGPNEEQSKLWRESVLFGQTRAPLKEVEHPSLGTILVGGSTKYGSRIPPPFMAEEEHHRNFAFTMFHAAQMPKLRFADIRITELATQAGAGLWQIDVEVANDRLIPTRTERAASKAIGQPDRLALTGAKVLAAGLPRNRFDRAMSEQRYRPATLEVEEGISGRGSRFFRFLVEGKAGETIGLSYVAEKASPITMSMELRATASEPPVAK
jgi:hypothetical protein